METMLVDGRAVTHFTATYERREIMRVRTVLATCYAVRAPLMSIGPTHSPMNPEDARRIENTNSYPNIVDDGMMWSAMRDEILTGEWKSEEENRHVR